MSRTSRNEQREWYGVDFDGTLAKTLNYKDILDRTMPPPVWPMVERVRRWLLEGKNVRIMTARVCGQGGQENAVEHRALIERFCAEHLGVVLPITHEKDFDMIELWDDRAVQVERDTGEPTTYWTSRAE